MRTKKEKKLKINKAYLQLKREIRRFKELNILLGKIQQDWEEMGKIPIVRCKDCKWYDKGENASEEWSECKLPIRPTFSVGDYDYCSWGDTE